MGVALKEVDGETSPGPDGIRINAAIGCAVAFILAVLLGGWAATAELAGAVIAGGTIVVDGHVKKVQHPSGGVVGEIRVREGDKVEAGDVVLRLDETVTRANLQVITRQLDELGVRAARLKAERDGTPTFDPPPVFAARIGEPEIREIMLGEYLLLTSRRIGRAGQKAQLAERITQLEQEISGLGAQHAAKLQEIELVKKELDGLEKLHLQNLVSTTKYVATHREATRLNGERGHLFASLAQARGKIAEIQLQIIQLDQDLRTEVIKELRDIQAKEAELNERRVAAEDQLKRVDIRAPLSGTIHQLAVHTIGGVINQSEPIMLIVPQVDALVVEARIAPQDIDQVKLAQTAFIRFTAFNQRTTPELVGSVSRVSADLTREPQTNQAFYTVRISLTETELSRLGDLKLIPGMPAEVYIKTDERTALSYLVKPLSDQFTRAFRER